MNKKQTTKKRRHMRIRAKVSGTNDRPRLSIFRSNKYIYAQLIDDTTGTTLLTVSDFQIKKGDNKKTKTERAGDIGGLIAKAAKKQHIKAVVFDRGGFRYAGRIAALAKSAREEGLIF